MKTIFLSLAFFLSFCVIASAKNQLALVGQVTHIVDGDTFDISHEDTRIRLWGINAPERGEDGYDDSKSFLHKIIGSGELQCIPKYTGYFNRTVAVCYSDGIDIAKIMVLSGMAYDYEKYSDGYYKQDETNAEFSRRGFWKFRKME